MMATTAATRVIQRYLLIAIENHYLLSHKVLYKLIFIKIISPAILRTYVHNYKYVASYTYTKIAVKDCFFYTQSSHAVEYIQLTSSHKAKVKLAIHLLDY